MAINTTHGYITIPRLIQKMIKTFIPSYNRPMQLHALLESILMYDQGELFNNIEIRYKASTPEIQLGYDKIINSIQIPFWAIKILPESNSRYKDIMSSFDEPSDFWAMTTDDSIFYREFHLNELQLDKVLMSDVDHFSFRLGLNTTTIDYSKPQEQHYLSGQEIDFGLMRFYRPNHQGHYGHPFAVDSYLSRTEYVKNMILKVCSPSGFDYRSLECRMSDYMRSTNNRPFTVCPKQSWLVNSPSNMVSDGPYLKNGVQHKFTVEELNQKYLDGYKIDIEAIKPNSIHSVQQELAFEFIKNDN